MQKAVSLTCAVFVLLAPSLGAQETGSSGAPTVEAARVGAVEQTAAHGLPALDDASAATPPRVEALAARRRQSATRSVLHTIGGAAVGAFVGYFTSQVVRSDWDKETNSEMNGHRMSFALGGALAGSVGGLLIGNRAPVAQMGVPVRSVNDDKVITTEQIVSSGLARLTR
jgi:hypothetical protein